MRKMPQLGIFLLSVFWLVCSSTEVLAWEASKRQAESAVELGGWLVVYSNEISEREAERGMVAPGIFLSDRRDRREARDWAEALIFDLVRQAERDRSIGRSALRSFGTEEQRQARRLTVETVRDLLYRKSSGISPVMVWDSVEFKTGIIEYRERSRDRRRPDMVFVPYVALRLAPELERTRGDRRERRDRSWDWDSAYIQESPQVQIIPYTPPSKPSFGFSSTEILNSFSLTNTARNVGRDQWEWTAFISGPEVYVQRIRSVTYYLHPSFQPHIRQGNPHRPGHPLTAIGWGVFQLEAEVILDDGSRRTYRHLLRFM
jgi:hypothetical protein